MNVIVPWKETVGGVFLDTFEKISKSLAYAKAKGALDYEAATRKENSEEDWTRYSEKRALMRMAGWEILPNGTPRWHGWYAPYVDGKDLKFKTTSPTGRSPIILAAFLDFKRGLDQSLVEDEYYGAADPDFPRE